MAGCGQCRAIRSDLKESLLQGDIAAAAKTALKGATTMAAHALKRPSRKAPPVIVTRRR